MNHLDEETLVLFHYGEGEGRDAVEAHLRGCDRCRSELEALVRDLEDIGSMPVPERDAEYGARVWRSIAPRLIRPHPVSHRRRTWMLGVAAALLVGTFLAGRLSTRLDGNARELSQGPVRERVLLVALSEHLDRSEMLLLEVVNADDVVDGREAAQELLQESRLYRQTAYGVGDVGTSDVLEELERLFLDVANGSTPSDRLRVRIEERDVLFKIRVLQTNVRAREEELVKKF